MHMHIHIPAAARPQFKPRAAAQSGSRRPLILPRRYGKKHSARQWADARGQAQAALANRPGAAAAAAARHANNRRRRNGRHSNIRQCHQRDRRAPYATTCPSDPGSASDTIAAEVGGHLGRHSCNGLP